MSTLSGWAGKPGRDTSEPIRLDRMLSAARRHADATLLAARGTTHAMGVVADAKPASVYFDESIQAAIVGNVYWQDPQLADLAKRDGDARALAEAYRQRRGQYLPLLRGAFALALSDIAAGETQLAIDPLGIERLCYTLARGQLVFSNSLDSIRAHPEVTARLSPQALFNYFYFQNIPAPETIYAGVSKLQPGEVLTFSAGEIKRSRYWNMHYRDNGPESVDALVAEFHRLLDSGVRKPLDRFPSIGAFLSGGTDSSSVTAGMARVGPSAPKTFSIGFDAEGYDESGYARITADRFHTDHRHYYVTGDDVCNTVPRVAAYYDEPFGNASAVPTYHCARLARDSGVENLLAGDGGDEIFGGNERYLKQKIFGYYERIPAPLRRGLLEPAVLHFPLGEKLSPVRKLRSYIEQANIPLPDRLETYNFLHRDSLESIFSADFLREVDTHAPLNAQREVYNAADSAASLNRMLFLDLKFTLADNDLRKVNGMCEMAGVNVHYPLIDMDMVEFAARVPVDLKIKGHKLRWFFKHALKDTLATETLTKSKHGFGLPFGVWLNDHAGLHELASDSLEKIKARGYLRPDYIDALWARHRAGHGSYYGTMIWICMMLEQWLESHR